MHSLFEASPSITPAGWRNISTNSTPSIRGTTPRPTPRELKELGLEDEWLSKVHYVEVGPNGERIDKGDYISAWEQAVQANAEDSPILKKIQAGQLLTDAEEAELAQSLNSARFYFNEDNLKQAYRRPQGNLIDFVKAALGMEKIKSQEEELAENFRAWLITQKLSPKQANYLIGGNET